MKEPNMTTAAFNAVRLSWRGQPFTIPPNQVLRAIATVEDVITIGELCSAQARGAIPPAKVARAYGAALRFAGAEVTDDQVYIGMFIGGDTVEAVNAAVSGLLAMMVPAAALSAPGGAPQGNVPAPAPAGSSKRRSRRSSAAAT